MNSQKQSGLASIVIILIIIGASAITGGLWYWQNQKKGEEELNKQTEQKLEEIITHQPSIAKEELNYKNALQEMFPGKSLIQTTNRKDCFFDEKSGCENYYDIYCVESAKEGFFVDSIKKTLLLVIRFGVESVDSNYAVNLKDKGMPSNAHAVGIYHAFLGLFDIESKKLLTELFVFDKNDDVSFWHETHGHLVADKGQISFYNGKDGTFIFFSGTAGGQGYLSGEAKLIQIKDGKFEKVWPEEKHWPGEYKSVEIQENKIIVNEFTPKFVPEYVGPAEIELKNSYELYWDESTCRFESK